MTGIADLVTAGKEFGIFEFYLPFVILFAILYGLLQKSKIFGEKGKAINLIISLAASLFVMEYALAAPLSVFFSTYFSQTLAVLVSILGFLMVTYLLMALFGGQPDKNDVSKYLKYIVVIGVILAAATFVSSGGMAIFPGLKISETSTFDTSQFGLNMSTQDIGIIIIVVLLIGVIIWLVKSEGGSKETERPSDFEVRRR